ncbi:MAG TPA: cation-translocating P-type ATPase [Telluria sp.]
MDAPFAGIDRDSLRRAGRMVVSIDGMWCGSCAMAVERTLARSPGVTWASTSFAGGSALVRWDPLRVDLDEMFARVEKLGYRILPLVEAQEMERQVDEQARAVWLRLAVAGFFGMWSMLGTLALYLDAGLAASPQGWWVALASCLAALPVVTWSAQAFYRAGWRTLRAGVPGMDALISLGVLASCVLSAWALARGSAEVYPDSATMLVTFLLCGRLVELHARRRNSAAVNALRQAVPETARRIVDGSTATEVPVTEVQPGDLVLVHAGERIAVDGVIEEGESEVDRAVLNGESAPALVRPGERVAAGCINLSCRLLVRVEQPYGQRFIDRIGVRMLELFGAKSAIAMQAERFARWLVPAALLLSAATFGAGWIWTGDAVHSALRALSVLVAACPCAVGLALPLAYAASAASAAGQGILFRDPASLEALAHAREIMFDKTGTLTEGRLEVAEVLAGPTAAPSDVLYWAALAEADIAHPVAQAIRTAAAQAGGNQPPGQARRYGQGSSWHSADGEHKVLVGNAAFLALHGVSVPAAGDGTVATRIEVARDGAWIGSLLLHDQLRGDARGALEAFTGGAVAARLVTGDSARAAAPVAAAVGLDPSRVHAACQPAQKAEVVEAAQKPAVFVGDGINDALALAAADCGISVQGASTAAVATAGVVIASGGLRQVVVAWEHARLTMRVVRQNLAFSMVYNVLVLGLASSGAVPPAAAAFAMLASSLSVIANSSRLLRAPQAAA